MRNSKLLKNTNFFIDEDFSAETRKIRKKLRYYMLEARISGKFARLYYNKLKIDNDFYDESSFEDLPAQDDRAVAYSGMPKSQNNQADSPDQPNITDKESIA